MVRTKGNIIVENIKLGDIIYEYDLGYLIKSKVITLPKRDNDGFWIWESKNLVNDKIIKYAVHEKYPQYAPRLYNYEVY